MNTNVVVDRVEIKCTACVASRQTKLTPAGEPRTPAGWKRLERDGSPQAWCAVCWRQRYLLRAVTFAVASPLDCTWEEFRAALKLMWQETTRASNWMMTELYARDIRREPGDEKLRPMPRVYLYPEARALFPGLPPQTVASLEQACQRKYRAKRYEVLWTRGASLPTYRYPTPFPVHNQSWYTEDGERPVVNVRIADNRWRICLKGGPQFRRQRRAFDDIHGGLAVPGELAIYQSGKSLLVKLVAWLPREQSPAAVKRRTGVLSVRTDADKLLVAVNGKDETLWNYNGDHIVRWIAEHQRQLQRWAEDAKYENRPVPSFATRREAAVQKFHNRMSSAAHEIAAQLAGYAERRRFAAVRYDDTERSYCDFVWARLRSLIAEKLDAREIALELVASSEAAKESADPLANGETDAE